MTVLVVKLPLEVMGSPCSCRGGVVSCHAWVFWPRIRSRYASALAGLSSTVSPARTCFTARRAMSCWAFTARGESPISSIDVSAEPSATEHGDAVDAERGGHFLARLAAIGLPLELKVGGAHLPLQSRQRRWR